MSQITTKNFDATLSKVVGNLTKMRDTLHSLCMFALAQGLLHGNNNPAVALLDKLPNTANKKGIAQWLVEFGPFKIKDGVVSSAHPKRRQEPEKFLSMADETPFWEFSKHSDGEIKPTNFQSLLVGLLAKAKREAAEGKQVVGLELAMAIEASLSDTVKEEVTKRSSTKKAA